MLDDFKAKVSDYDRKVFGTITKYWARAVRFVRAKEFLAEMLGTFMLVVSASMGRISFFTFSCLPREL